MKVIYKKLFFIANVFGAFNLNASLLDILPADLDVLIQEADIATHAQLTDSDDIQFINELNKWYDLVAKIYKKTRGIVGEHFLAVKQLSALKKQFKQELTKIKKEQDLKSAHAMYVDLGKNHESISYKALKQSITVAQEAKKWLCKAHAQEKNPKKIMKVAKK